jgi:hypothetical protein
MQIASTEPVSAFAAADAPPTVFLAAPFASCNGSTEGPLSAGAVDYVALRELP